MKIDHIHVHNLHFDYPDRYGFTYAGGACTGRFTTLVEVHTDTGHVGIGSVYTHPLLAEIVIKHDLEPFLLGQDPREVERLWELMYGLTRWYGRKGPAMTALGGLDTAFWDLRAKSAGKPLVALLGGTKRTCPAYASNLLWKPPEELAAEAAGHVAAGFRRMKMRLGRGDELDRACVIAVRRAIGPGNDLLVDGSMRYSLPAARRLGAFLAEQKVFWFEEPFAPENLEAFAALRGTVGVPIAAGENEFGVQGFAELVRMKAVDIVQPDVSRCGGVTEAVRVAKLAAEHGLRVATHTWNDAVAVTANAHYIASLPHGITVEIDRTGNPFIEQLLVEPLKVRDGLLTLSDAPGLGIELNRGVIERHRLAPGMPLPAGVYSDMVFGNVGFSPAPQLKEE